FPIFFAFSFPISSPFSWKMPQPWGGFGCPVSSPAMNQRVPPFLTFGKKQIWALMSRPFGSSSRVVMTRWCLNGGALSYAFRLLPSPLNTIARLGPERCARDAPAAGTTSAVATAAAARISRARRIGTSLRRLQGWIERLGGDEALEP